MLRPNAIILIVSILPVALGCDGSTLLEDAGILDAEAEIDTGPEMLCTSDRDCYDGVHCNGVERCRPGSSSSDPRGCAAAETGPCLAGQECDEAAARCFTDCDMSRDADGDGHDSLGCGGDDCDDSDGTVYPGAPEVCDSIDQDCNPDTLAASEDGDADGDGFISIDCCNPVDSGAARCGTDCDDGEPGVNTSTPEVCNSVDDDCDSRVDEGLEQTFYRDEDSDLYGAASGSTVACAAPPGFVAVAGDCDDANPAINPSGVESCDSADNDCDSLVDEEAAELGSDDHCSACGDACQFECVTASRSCALPVEVDAGGSHACARLDTGRVYCWGAGTRGQLGRASLVDGLLARPVSGIAAADQLALGAESTCLLEGGTIRCFGDNRFGQVDASTASAEITSAVPVVGSRAFSELACGGRHCCAIQALGSSDRLVCWGDNERGQLGIGATGGTRPPTTVAGSGAPSQVVAGFQYTCIRRTDGRVYCWGSGSQLGQGASSDDMSAESTSVEDLVNTVRLFGSPMGLHTAAISTSAGAVIWGTNAWGEGGGGFRGGRFRRATAVSGGLTFDELAVGQYASYGIAGTVLYSWGRDNAGQLAQSPAPSDGYIAAPAATAGVGPAAQVTAGEDFACAITATAEVVCWGANSAGQVGQGRRDVSSRPAPVLSR